MRQFLARARRVLLQIVLTLLFCYLALRGLVFFNQRHLVFPVPPGVRQPVLLGSRLGE